WDWMWNPSALPRLLEVTGHHHRVTGERRNKAGCAITCWSEPAALPGDKAEHDLIALPDRSVRHCSPDKRARAVGPRYAPTLAGVGLCEIKGPQGPAAFRARNSHFRGGSSSAGESRAYG